MKKEPVVASKFKTKLLPDELAKMLTRAQGRSLAECEQAKVLVPEFDLVKNYPLTPSHVTAGSGIVVYWAANCFGRIHKFRNTVSARVNAIKRESETRGCKLCSKFKYIPSMPIRKHYPLIASEWMERENEFPTRYLDCRSSRIGLFKCSANPKHIYRCRVKNRTVDYHNQGCPYCYEGDRADLQDYPELFALYDRTRRNRGYKLESLPFCHKVRWRCEYLHRWSASFAKMLNRPYCKKCIQEEAIEETLACRPEICADYDPVLNESRPAEAIPLEGNSALILNWRCQNSKRADCGEDHLYSARLYDRLQGSGCPVCAGRKTSAENNLANGLYANVIAEIDLEAHPDLILSAISPGSTKKLSFVCSDCGRKWKARIDYRCLLNKGCSSCKAKSRVKANPVSVPNESL